MEFLRDMDCGFSDLAEALSFDYLWGVSLSGKTRIARRKWDVWPQTLVGFVDCGAIDIIFPDKPNIHVSSGSGYCVLTGTKHSYYIEGNSRFRLWNAHVRFRVFRGPDILPLLGIPTHIPPKPAKLLGEACQLLFNAHNTPKSTAERLAARLEGAGRLLAALTMVSQNGDALAAWVTNTERLQPALVHIHQHFDQPMRRKELASLVHVSEAHFHELFRNAMGVAPLVYVKRIRLEHAQHLLRATEDPINEIGRICGYPDPYHFSRTFTTFLGMSPRDYRKHARRAWKMDVSQNVS